MSRAPSDPVRVLVVDDHPFYLEGIKALLATRCEEVVVVATAGSGEESVSLVADLDPDVVLMDLRMPGMGGLAATREIAHRTAVLVLTMHDDDSVLSALRAGARGYLLKDAGIDELVGAIVAVHRGQSVLAPQAARRVEQRLRDPGGGPGRAYPQLTDREDDVLDEICRGHSTTEIAARLGLSDKTVRNYTSAVLTKLQVRDRAALVALAREAGYPRD